MRESSRRTWSHKELILAFNLYCKLPFGRYHAHNPEVNKLATWIGRTPGAVAMKLSNFASLDPFHQARGIRGLSNISVTDRAIWDEFHHNWSDLVVASEQLLRQYVIANELSNPQTGGTGSLLPPLTGPTEVERSVTVRIGQDFFRRTILASYRERCCICSLPVASLLIASHIVPWHEREELRLDPHNGLCLCTLHDRAFDTGLLTISDQYQVLIGAELKRHIRVPVVANEFAAYHEHPIILPDKFAPRQEYLSWHRDNVWQG